MKKIFSIISITLLFAACKREAYKDFQVSDRGNIASVSGTWKGASLIQKDNDAIAKDFPYKTQDVTSLFEFSKVILTLNAANGAPSNFTINYNGAPPLFKLTQGNWKADNLEKVGLLSLINGTDTVKLTMGSYQLLGSNKMMVSFSKLLLGKPVITYECQFTK